MRESKRAEKILKANEVDGTMQSTIKGNRKKLELDAEKQIQQNS